MDKWFKDILPDKDPYHNRGRDQMRKKGGPDFLYDVYLYIHKGMKQSSKYKEGILASTRYFTITRQF
jgi:hypothetical protein